MRILFSAIFPKPTQFLAHRSCPVNIFSMKLLKIILCTYFQLHWVFVAAPGLSLVVVNTGYSLAVSRLLLVAVASTVVEHKLKSAWASATAARGLSIAAPGLQSTDWTVVSHGLECSMARGILPDQELNPSLWHWQVDSLTTKPPGKPSIKFLLNEHSSEAYPNHSWN